MTRLLVGVVCGRCGTLVDRNGHACRCPSQRAIQLSPQVTVYAGARPSPVFQAEEVRVTTYRGPIILPDSMVEILPSGSAPI